MTRLGKQGPWLLRGHPSQALAGWRRPPLLQSWQRPLWRSGFPADVCRVLCRTHAMIASCRMLKPPRVAVV